MTFVFGFFFRFPFFDHKSMKHTEKEKRKCIKDGRQNERKKQKQPIKHFNRKKMEIMTHVTRREMVLITLSESKKKRSDRPNKRRLQFKYFQRSYW